MAPGTAALVIIGTRAYSMDGDNQVAENTLTHWIEWIYMLGSP